MLHKSFYDKKNINIGFVTPYVHKKKGIAECYYRILAIMKGSLLIETRLPVNFWAESIDTIIYLYYYNVVARVPAYRTFVIPISPT